MPDPPHVLFVCVHNAGRSQMAAALLERHAAGRITVRSAGTQPADQINPAVIDAMHEVGIDLAGAAPKRLDDDTVRLSDVVITMGCGDECPFYPGIRYLDWQIDDPAGKPLDQIRPIRDEIDSRVRALVGDLLTGEPGSLRTSERVPSGATRHHGIATQRGVPMSEPMKQAWNDVEEGFSTLGRMMKERYQGTGQGESADAAAGGGSEESGAALRAAFERLVAAGRELGDRAADVARDDDVKAQAKRAAASLNDALSATVDLIGDEVGGLFKRSKHEDPTPEVAAPGAATDDAPP